MLLKSRSSHGSCSSQASCVLHSPCTPPVVIDLPRLVAGSTAALPFVPPVPVLSVPLLPVSLLPVPLPSPTLLPVILAHFNNIEQLGCASFWCGEVGHAKLMIESRCEYLVLAEQMYALELGSVVVDTSHSQAPSRSQTGDKGKSKVP